MMVLVPARSAMRTTRWQAAPNVPYALEINMWMSIRVQTAVPRVLDALEQEMPSVMRAQTATFNQIMTPAGV